MAIFICPNCKKETKTRQHEGHMVGVRKCECPNCHKKQGVRLVSWSPVDHFSEGGTAEWWCVDCQCLYTTQHGLLHTRADIMYTGIPFVAPPPGDGHDHATIKIHDQLRLEIENEELRAKLAEQ